MEINKMLLLLIDLYDKKMSGKTTVQKRMYFLSDYLSADFGFHHYYYGPFSNLVNQAIDHNCGLGFLNEELNFFPPDQKRFDYELTNDGNEFVKFLRSSDDQKIIYKIKKFHEIMINSGDNGDYNLLSWASKIHYVTNSNSSSKFNIKEIKDKLKKYGWNLNSKEIKKGKDFLEKFRMLKTS